MNPMCEFKWICALYTCRLNTTDKSTTSDVQLKEAVGELSVLFMPENRKTLVEAADPASAMASKSADFRDPTSDAPIVAYKLR